MALSETVTLTLPRADFYQLCNLLQLMCVLDVRLNMAGSATPDMAALQRVWDVLCMTTLPPPPAPKEGDSSSSVMRPAE